MSLEALTTSVEGYFGHVAREVFADDPASNPNLRVEVLGATVARDTPTMVVITPWTVIGLAFPPDGQMPSELRIDHHHYPVLSNEVEAIGRYHSALLIPDVSGYSDQAVVREEVMALAPGLTRAIESWRGEHVEVADSERRAFMRNLAGHRDPTPAASPFGAPDETSMPYPEE